MQQLSPVSSPGSPADQEQPANLPPHLNSHQFFAIEEQQLHLAPCTWDEFLQLDPPSCGPCDYVNGLVVCCPNMADAEHNGLGKAHATSVECSDGHIFVRMTPSLQVVSELGKKEWTLDHDHSSSRASLSSSPPPAEAKSGLHHPGYSITKIRRDSSGSSSTSRDPAVSKRIEHPHPYSSKLLGVAEITSHSTRQVDLYAKWAAYALSEVPLYVIFDRGTKTTPKRVIAGALKEFSGAEKSWHGDPDKTKKTRPGGAPTYYKKVYQPTDKVDCPIYSKLNLTAAQLLDLTTMWKLASKMHYDRASHKKRAEKEKQRREKAEQERERAEQDLDRVEKQMQELEERTKRSREHADQKQQPRDERHAERNDATGPSTKSPTRSPQHKSHKKN